MDQPQLLSLGRYSVLGDHLLHPLLVLWVLVWSPDLFKSLQEGADLFDQTSGGWLARAWD